MSEPRPERRENRPHPPSQARQLVQEAKSGRRPIDDLLAEAAAIEDPSFAAEALVGLAADPRLSANAAGHALDEAARLMRHTEREWRRAEVIAHAAQRLRRIRPDAATWRPHQARFHGHLLDLALALPPGPSASQAIQALAPVTPPDLRAKLLRKALTGPEPLPDAKAILAEGPAPGLREAIQNESDPLLRTRLFAAWHVRGGQSLPDALAAAARLDAVGQVEALRGLVAALEDAADLATIHAHLPKEPEPRARILSALAARADRLGDTDAARAWFNDATEAAAQVSDPKAQAGVLKNIEAGLARVGAPAPSKAKPAPAATTPATALPSTPSQRHILALCDTYEGKVGDVHLRAIARVAPLCQGFGLDLGLVGFPVTDVPQLLKAAARETNIGGGEDYLRQLAEAGRVHLIPWDRDHPSDLRPWGLPVATMSDPDAAKAADFAGALEKARAAGAPRLLVIMGLGKNGLPVLLRRFTPVHLELTGQHISLETATAMGIIADRLRQVPPV